MSKFRKLVLVSIVGSMTLAGTAQAACWSPAAVDAAHVRDLQSRLMVAALRCAKSEHDVLPHYNRFVRGQKPLLKLGNGILRSHFAKGRNKKQAIKHYDRYAVSLANKYGAGSGDLSECKAMKELASSAADGDGKISSLVNISQFHGLSPHLPSGRCGIVIASSKN
ncbi:hypothetical protein GCM10009096_26380 [Parasphingorhabdus litoris]|uniref:Uncharacterized protein n=1 Tax=Parasphingorhabdus litoris TaxID=394733 RepID=A0ABN1AS40_9SPHN|nr:hypothetical protein [Parasphingorhabdus litoris]